MDYQVIAVDDLWQPGLLSVGRRAISLHLGEQIGPVILVADFDHVQVGNVAPRVIIAESRRNQKAHRLLDLTRDRFAFLPRMASEVSASRTMTPSLVAMKPLLKLVDEKT